MLSRRPTPGPLAGDNTACPGRDAVRIPWVYTTFVADASTGELVLSFAAGIAATLIGLGSKYFMDYRIERRRLQLQERTAMSDVMGNSLGQLRKSVIRLQDRLDSIFRDQRAVTEWLIAGPSPDKDGYFLRSCTQRIFSFLSWVAIVQGAMDALPPESVTERPDLGKLYKSLDHARDCLTNRLVIDESELHTDRQTSLLFVDTIDGLVDLGQRTYQQNDKTIPSTEFEEEYRMDREPLASLRYWLTLPRITASQPSIILARLACLRECLDLIQIGIADKKPQADRAGLTRIDRARLTAALDYAEKRSVNPMNLSATVPGKLEELLAS